MGEECGVTHQLRIWTTAWQVAARDSRHRASLTWDTNQCVCDITTFDQVSETHDWSLLADLCCNSVESRLRNPSFFIFAASVSLLDFRSTQNLTGSARIWFQCLQPQLVPPLPTVKWVCFCFEIVNECLFLSQVNFPSLGRKCKCITQVSFSVLAWTQLWTTDTTGEARFTTPTSRSDSPCQLVRSYSPHQLVRLNSPHQLVGPDPWEKGASYTRVDTVFATDNELNRWTSINTHPTICVSLPLKICTGSTGVKQARASKNRYSTWSPQNPQVYLSWLTWGWEGWVLIPSCHGRLRIHEQEAVLKATAVRSPLQHR